MAEEPRTEPESIEFATARQRTVEEQLAVMQAENAALIRKMGAEEIVLDVLDKRD